MHSGLQVEHTEMKWTFLETVIFHTFIISPTPYHHHHRSPSSLSFPFLATHFCKTSLSTSPPKLSPLRRPRRASLVTFSGSGGGGDSGSGGGGDSDGDAGERNRAEAIMALAEVGRSPDSIPKDFAAAIEAGRIPGSIVYRFCFGSRSLRCLIGCSGLEGLRKGCLTKVAIECGVGIFTKVGTGVTNVLITAQKAIDKSFVGESEDVPILSTSVAYVVYMAVSSNLRYQILAGVIEQRILEPLLHEQKLILSAICFAVRTGNTFLGSLMWVDYARWIGIQKIRE